MLVCPGLGGAARGGKDHEVRHALEGAGGDHGLRATDIDTAQVRAVCEGLRSDLCHRFRDNDAGEGAAAEGFGLDIREQAGRMKSASRQTA